MVSFVLCPGSEGALVERDGWDFLCWGWWCGERRAWIGVGVAEFGGGAGLGGRWERFWVGGWVVVRIWPGDCGGGGEGGVLVDRGLEKWKWGRWVWGSHMGGEGRGGRGGGGMVGMLGLRGGELGGMGVRKVWIGGGRGWCGTLGCASAI